MGLGDGKVFVGQLDGKLVALDQATGRVVWSVQAERWQEGYTITTAPLYFDGLVYESFLFPSRVDGSPHLSTRQYARIVDRWVREIGLDPAAHGTHFSQSSSSFEGASSAPASERV